MNKKIKPIGLLSAISMGIGAMVGAGIFSLLGEASAISGSAVYISFIIGGIIALFSGYSLGKLGAYYPSRGGIIIYLSKSYNNQFFVGTVGIILYFTAIVSLSLISKAFSNYAITFLPHTPYTNIWHHIFSSGIIIIFIFINLKGVKNVIIWENIAVGIKLIILVCLSIVGIIFIKPSLLATSNYPPIKDIFFSLSITFFAFEGFRVITNTAEDMENPHKTLPKAMMGAILLVMILYISISFAIFGNLSVDRVIATKDFALAEAALPIFDKIGFTIVALTALIAIASAINANLYAVTNITYQLAKNKELPSIFQEPIIHSTKGLIISGGLIIILSFLFDLSQIATIGSILILFIHTITHIGHLKIISKTNASKILIILAIIFSLSAMVLALIYTFKQSSQIINILIGFIFIAIGIEFLLHKLKELYEIR